MNNINQTDQQSPPLKLLRFAEVSKRTGLSRSAIWNYEKAGNFPTRIVLSSRAVAWYEHEIDAWLANLKENTIKAKQEAGGQLKPHQLWGNK